MSQFGSDQRQDVIRISREEIDSPHVDDLLKRQASLRGEGGVSRNRKGKWYYQNWFVFMMTGLLAAFAAWAIIEPFFDDMLYIQGPIQRMSAVETLPKTMKTDFGRIELEVSGTGWVQVNGEKVWMMDETRSVRGREVDELDVSTLETGQEIGLYISRDLYDGIGLSVAAYVVPEPTGTATSKATMSLARLNARCTAAGMLVSAVVAAVVGLAIGAADGIVCRLLRRAVLAGFVGLLVGFIGGFISNILGNLAYAPLSALAQEQSGDVAGGLSAFGFFVQIAGRSLGWCLAGMAMGLGQGIALRSGRILLYGFLGGIIGGLLGGLFFDPVDLLLVARSFRPSAHWSRMIGFMCVGGGVGAMIGIVELLARDAWLQMVQGPLSGKEFLIFKDTMHLGSSPRSEVYLFNDDAVAAQHAVIRSVGDQYEIENVAAGNQTQVNGRPVERSRLHHGDQITIGRTIFVFQKRKG